MESEFEGRANKVKKILRLVGILVILFSFGFNFYLIGLLRHNQSSFSLLKSGGTAVYSGLITKMSKKQLRIQEEIDGKKKSRSLVLIADTPFAVFPKDYQTLIPVGLASSKDDIVAGKTEASVSVQLPYLKKPQALRVNLVRDDLVTGKVIEVKDNSIKFKAYAASGFSEQTRNFTANATYQKLEADGKLSTIQQSDIKADQGLYAFLDKQTSDSSAQITRLIVADFTETK